MVVDTPQERAIANKKKVCLMSPGRASCKDLLEVIMDISQEPLCEHTGEQIDNGLVPRDTKEILEAIKDIRQERMCCLQYSSGKLNRDRVVCQPGAMPICAVAPCF